MSQKNNHVAIWLFVCCIMVAAMVFIGGVTRLTESGLSMTGWKPVTGWLPPIGEEQWMEEFGRYQQSPQYQKVNFGMSLDDFKGIFWLEYIHRLLGRIVSMIFFIPMGYFIATKQVSRRLAYGLGGIFLLGGLQGTIGWLMVSSGLKDDPRVSQYWLAFHLGMAFVVFTILFLLALNQSCKKECPSSFDVPCRLKAFSLIVTLLIFAQSLMGAFVAGLDAGLIYNTFPLMDGSLIPFGLFPPEIGIKAAFEDVKTVQFMHRTIAYIVVISVISFWFAARKVSLCGNKNRAVNALLAMVFVQFGLGVATLIHVVPVSLASAHQMGALFLLTISLYINYCLLKKGKIS